MNWGFIWDWNVMDSVIESNGRGCTKIRHFEAFRNIEWQTQSLNG